MGEFRLEARDFQDLTRWRWMLTEPNGALVADHEVRLDAGCWQYEAFSDLLGYLSWHVVPDRRIEDEARIVAEIGEWIGEQVFGPVAAALVRARPATVCVTLPTEPMEAQSLLFRPLELARVGGKPLSVQDVTLVMQLGSNDGTSGVAPIGERLRVLGLFSLPVGGQPLNLRRERHALVRLVTGIAAVGRAADIRVLQYGVTRERLRDVLEDGEGWDIIHISGHGAPGELLLETEDGSPDRVTAAELARLLDLARDRVKMVTVSACWSAALTVADQRRLLGLPQPVLQAAPGGIADQHDGEAAGALAAELARQLRSAVLAMRFPVVDDFAIAFGGRLYDLLARHGRPLPRAIGMALRQTVEMPPTPACPALSAGTPALFGARAVDLRLAAPARTKAESYDAGLLKMTGFPPQPDRFVGRTAVMARASAMLADASGVPGVLLHGMPGGGKTACAVELAYTHEHAFDRLVWFRAPDEGCDTTGALTDFAFTLEARLPGFQMVHLLEDPVKLAAFLPELTELMEQRRVLIVVDNIESLLSESGQWRDARWGLLTAALCAHAGLGRVVLTSRHLPANLAGLAAVAVNALSLDEALLLIDELPRLRALIHGELSGVERGAAQRLAVGALNIAQGHPKLLELADGQADNPARLAVLIAAGNQAWGLAGGLPEGFLATGEPQAVGEDYLRVLAAWTQAVSGTLAPGERTLLWFLCCLEEDDRIRPVADGNWADLWSRLELAGDPLDLDEALKELVSRGLVAVRPESNEPNESYEIHPGVAAAGRAQAGKQFQDAVDTELAAFWSTLADYALGREGEDRTSGLVVVRAGLGAAPYLMRLQEWSVAAALLESALQRDGSRATAAAVLPALQAITATGQDPQAASVLARALRLFDPAAAERHMRDVMDTAVAHGDYQAASMAAGWLAQRCRDGGRLAEALTLADQQASYTRQAGLGPWTQLGDEVLRLQILSEMGQAEQVLSAVQQLRAHMQVLPAVPDQPESAIPWNVREGLLGTGRVAALKLGRWNDVLDLGTAIAASERDRGAPAAEIARTMFNNYFALIRIGRIDDAMTLLLDCRQIFENAHDIPGLGKVLSALADVENRRVRGDAAISFEQDALRYKYLAGDVIGIVASYHNLGSYLRLHGRRPADACAHHLAASLIGILTSTGGVGDSERSAAIDLRTGSEEVAVPANVADLCRQVGETGPELERLLTVLAPDLDTAQQTLQELTAHVQALAAAPRAALTPSLAMWDPVIAAVLAAASGDMKAAAALDAELDRHIDSADWTALVAALRRLRAGESGPQLLIGLDEINTAIAARALDALNGTVDIPVSLWPAIKLGPLLSIVVAGAIGNSDAAGRARQILDAMADDPEVASLATALGRILEGDRAQDIAERLTDPMHRAVVATVLHHIGLG